MLVNINKNMIKKIRNIKEVYDIQNISNCFVRDVSNSQILVNKEYFKYRQFMKGAES